MPNIPQSLLRINKRTFLSSCLGIFVLDVGSVAAMAPDDAWSVRCLIPPVLTNITKSTGGSYNILADLTLVRPGDIITLQCSNDIDFSDSVFQTSAAIEFLETLSLRLIFSPNILAGRSYYFRAKQARGEFTSLWSNPLAAEANINETVRSPAIELKQYAGCYPSPITLNDSYNGGKFQFNPNFFAYSTGSTMNAWKAVTRLNGNPLDNTSPYDPSKHNSDGYMTTQYGGGYYRLVNIVPTSYRAGNWVLAWTGSMNFASIGPGDGTVTAVSGSLSGTNGRYEFSTTSTYLNIIIQPSSANGLAANVTDIRLYNVNDEAALNAGGTWSAAFVALVSKIGVFRFMNWSDANKNMARDWSDRTRRTCESWGDGYNDQTYWGGDTAGSANDYIATVSGFSLVHGAKAKVRINRTQTADPMTLNINSTGQKQVVSYYGVRQATSYLISGSVITFIYDADSQMWVATPNEQLPTRLSGSWITDGVPPDAMVELCNLANCHPWFSLPYMAADNDSDYATQLATYCLANLNAGLIPRFEVANEIWNPGLAFHTNPFSKFKQAVYDSTVWRGYWTASTSYVIGDGMTSNGDWFICKTAHTSTATAPDPATPATYTANWTKQSASSQWAGRANTIVGKAVSAVYSNNRTKYWMIAGVQAYGGTSNAVPNMEAQSYVAKTGQAGDAPKFWCTHVAPACYWHSSYEDSPANSYLNPLEATWAAEYPAATKVRKYELLRNYIESQSGTNIFTLETCLAKLTQWARFCSTYSMGMTCYEGGWDCDKSGANGDTATQQVYDFRAASYNHPALIRQLQRIAVYVESLPNNSGFPAIFQISGVGTWSVFDPNIYATPSSQWDGMIKWNAGVKVFNFAISQ